MFLKYNPLTDKLSPPPSSALYNCSALFFLRKYDIISHFFSQSLVWLFETPFFYLLGVKSMREWEKIADSRFSERWILRLDVKISRTKIFSISPSKSVYRGGIGEISIRQHNKLGWNEVKETKMRVLNTFAETNHVSFSQVLQDALTAMYQRQMAKWYEQGEYAKKKKLLFFRGFFHVLVYSML